MCGIAGFLGLSCPAQRVSVLHRMTYALMHRGPDGEGYYFDHEVGLGLGHRRLAIVDLSDCGKQPMASASKRYVVAFNGEIYNFQELRTALREKGHVFRGHSDTEVALAAFEEWGIARSIDKFVGMFAFAIWDRQERELVLVRDRIGKKPLYYGFLNGAFVFASQLRPLVCYPGWEPTIDRAALAAYMRHNYVPSPLSIYEQVKKLPPGHVLRIGAGTGVPVQVELACYWNAAEIQLQAIESPFAGSLDDAVEELEHLLENATSVRMIADVPLGAFLSGGVDSSLIVSLMQAQASSPVRTFTIGFDNSNYNEAVYAKEIAKHLGTAHTELYISPDDALSVIPELPQIYDEPFSDSSQVPTYLVSTLARQHVTVALSGDGGDEGFCGYNRYLWWRKIRHISSRVPYPLLQVMSRGLLGVPAAQLDRMARVIYRLLPRSLRFSAAGDRLHKLAGMLTIREPQNLYRHLVSHWTCPEDVVLGGKEPNSLLDIVPVPEGEDRFVDWMMLLDAITYLPDDILVKVDRATMAVGLEARSPLLDHRVLEFAWSLPLSFKLNEAGGKVVLKKILYKRVPRELLERAKTGFGVPLDSWLRGPLREWAESLLFPARLREEGYFAVEPIRSRWEEHLSGARQWQYHLWDVLMFQCWLDAQRTWRTARNEGYHINSMTIPS
jgi:asparagine synthase (glutamine-hydrolysing)